jgi:type I restriction enzyme S subunit
MNRGTTIPSLVKSELQNIEISLPPLAEQQRIVAILDEAFAGIAKAKANAEQNLKNAKELFESYLQGVFEGKGEGWEEKTLGEVCEISSKLIDPKKPEYQDLIHIGAGNIESQKGTLIDLKTAKEENLISEKFLFDESMVLYSKIRPYLMKVANCNFQGLCSADIYPLLPFKGKIIKEFLYHLLLTKDFTDYAILGSQRAGMPKVNREHLFAYSFNLPPITEQQAIVRKLDALSAETKRLEAIYQQKINDLEELKKSVLQKAFSGELRSPEGAEYRSEGHRPSLRMGKNIPQSPERA